MASSTSTSTTSRLIEVTPTSNPGDSEDIVIAVVGKLAHGKTSFIEFLANPDENEVLEEKPGYDVPAVTVRRLQGWYQDRLVFIDTPGFGEPYGTLDIVLDNIKKCLHKFKYKQLAGIIYLYAFNNQNSPTQAENWPTEAPTRAQFASMEKLCPQDRITFATCDWARPSEEAQRNQVEDFIEKRKVSGPFPDTFFGRPSKLQKKRTETAKWREFLSNQETARAIVSEIVEDTAGPPHGSAMVDLAEPRFWDHLAISFKLKNIICAA